MAGGRGVATLARDTFGLEREHRAPHRDFRRTQPRQRLQLVAPDRKRQVPDGGQRRQPQIDGLRGQHRGVREISHRKPHGGLQCVQLRGQARLHDERPRGARRKGARQARPVHPFPLLARHGRRTMLRPAGMADAPQIHHQLRARQEILRHHGIRLVENAVVRFRPALHAGRGIGANAGIRVCASAHGFRHVSNRIARKNG